MLRALGAAADAGADVAFVYDAKLPTWQAERREWTEHGPCTTNDVSIEACGVRKYATRRAAGASAIQHNKFLSTRRRPRTRAGGLEPRRG